MLKTLTQLNREKLCNTIETELQPNTFLSRPNVISKTLPRNFTKFYCNKTKNLNTNVIS